MLNSILLTIHIIVCIALIGVILLQRSEGGAFGMGGGNNGGFMTARGAGDLLTRTTAILATLFFVLSLGLTLRLGAAKSTDSLVERMKTEKLDLKNQLQAPAPAGPSAPPPATPANGSASLQVPAPAVGAPPAAPGPDPLAGLTGPAPAKR